MTAESCLVARFFGFSDIYKLVGQLYHEDGFLYFLFEFLSLSYLIYRRGDCHDTFAFLWSIVPCQAASLMAHRDKWTAELALEHSSARRTRTVPFWEPYWLVWKEAARRRRVWQPTPWEEESVCLRRQRKSQRPRPQTR